jgi:hypothetical protein
MTEPNCPKCGSTKFYIAQGIEVEENDHPFDAICCESCGGIIGILNPTPMTQTEFKDTLLREIKKLIK